MCTESKKLKYTSLVFAAILSATMGSTSLAAEKNNIANVNAPGARATAFTYDGNSKPSPHDVQATATDGTNRATVNADIEGNKVTAGVGVRDADGITAVRANVSPSDILGGF